MSNINLLIHNTLQLRKQQREEDLTSRLREEQQKTERKQQMVSFNGNIRVQNFVKFKHRQFNPKLPWGVAPPSTEPEAESRGKKIPLTERSHQIGLSGLRFKKKVPKVSEEQVKSKRKHRKRPEVEEYMRNKRKQRIKEKENEALRKEKRDRKRVEALKRLQEKAGSKRHTPIKNEKISKTHIPRNKSFHAKSKSNAIGKKQFSKRMSKQSIEIVDIKNSKLFRLKAHSHHMLLHRISKTDYDTFEANNKEDKSQNDPEQPNHQEKNPNLQHDFSFNDIECEDLDSFRSSVEDPGEDDSDNFEIIDSEQHDSSVSLESDDELSVINESDEIIDLPQEFHGKFRKFEEKLNELKLIDKESIEASKEYSRNIESLEQFEEELISPLKEKRDNSEIDKGDATEEFMKSGSISDFMASILEHEKIMEQVNSDEKLVNYEANQILTQHSQFSDRIKRVELNSESKAIEAFSSILDKRSKELDGLFDENIKAIREALDEEERGRDGNLKITTELNNLLNSLNQKTTFDLSPEQTELRD